MNGLILFFVPYVIIIKVYFSLLKTYHFSYFYLLVTNLVINFLGFFVVNLMKMTKMIRFEKLRNQYDTL